MSREEILKILGDQLKMLSNLSVQALDPYQRCDVARTSATLAELLLRNMDAQGKENASSAEFSTPTVKDAFEGKIDPSHMTSGIIAEAKPEKIPKTEKEELYLKSIYPCNKCKKYWNMSCPNYGWPSVDHRKCFIGLDGQRLPGAESDTQDAN